MLSEQEKREMLEDARSKERRDNFRFAKDKIKEVPLSLDEYIKFLNDIQKIFGPFPISYKPTPTKFNKL
jgi:hypothetical protein